jgi:hypothetical protein
MSIITDLLDPIPVPKMVRIRQRFDSSRIIDPAEATRVELRETGALGQIKPGQQVAVAVGSRGIADIAVITKAIIEELQKRDAFPFIIPCMGSHGGASAQGQKEILKQLGVTEESMGVPIRSSMEVIQIGQLENGLPVYADTYAVQADAIIVINRIKPHTAFRGLYESGIMKMMTIGLGKQKGAEACHQLGFKHMAVNIPAMAKIIMAKLPIAFGVAIVENAYDQTCLIEVLPADRIEAREPELLVEAKGRMPAILFDQIDVLLIDYIGKNISGDGADPNVTGVFPTPYAHGGPDVNKTVVLDLTPESKGNASGIGTTDFTTRRLVERIDFDATYANGLTSTVVSPSKIPTTMDNDRYAIKGAVKTCNVLQYEQCRMVRIRDTLHLGEIEISVSMLEEARSHKDIEILTDPYELIFDGNGNLFLG